MQILQSSHRWLWVWKKWTQHIPFRHAIIEQLLPHKRTWSSVQAIQKRSQSQPCILVCFGKRRTWNFYADENNTGMERSEFVCTKNDMAKLKEILQKKHSFDSWTSEKVNTKSNFQTPNVKSFAALLKYIPMVYGGNLSNEPSLKNHSGNCFTRDRESHNTTLPGKILIVQRTGTAFTW